MTISHVGICGLILSLSLSYAADKEADMTDPYRIMGKHLEAMGGLKAVRGIKTIYKEATISFEGAGLEGTVRQWERMPQTWRQEIDLGAIKTSAGDNGETRWSVDPNGKIQIHRDQGSLQDRELKRLMNLYEYLDPQSARFKVSFEGVSEVNGENCYAITIASDASSTVQTNYYSAVSFHLVKMVVKRSITEETTYFSDFRSTDGIIMPFQENTEVSPTGEKQVIKYRAQTINASLAGVVFDPPAQDIKDYRFSAGSHAPDIPFEFIENHLYLPVTIGGKERVWVLDCGAAVTVIDSGYAASQGFAFAGSVKAQGAAGPVELFYVQMPAYGLKGIEFNEQKVLSMNIRDIFKPILGLEVAGILGYDFLSRFVARIDYAKEKLSLYDPEFFEYNGPGAVIESPLQDRMFSLDMTVDGVYSGPWRLDIGSGSIDFQFPFARDNGLLDRAGIDLIAIGAGGSQTIRASKFKTIEIAGNTFQNPTVGIPLQAGAGAFSHGTVIGNVGNVLLRNFVLYLDYARQRIILERGDDFGKVFPEDKSGLHLQYDSENRIIVSYLTPGTPAAEAGFLKGDVVVQINGRETGEYGPIVQLRKLFRGKTGSIYRITVLRNGEQMQLELVLRELL